MIGIYSDLTSNLETYNFDDLPNIYQIELVGGLCNLRCEECPVARGLVKRRENFFSIEELRKMINRGEFDNTFYTELQMYGEPLLHPKFDECVNLLRDVGILIGVSTNGTIWRDGLKKVDFITLSADSVLYRKGREDDIFSKVVERILRDTDAKIDVQVVETKDYNRVVRQLCRLMSDYSDRLLVRRVPDCFEPYYSGYNKDNSELCLNPFMSVSIHSDGDVVPCCFAWNKELVMGNIYSESLEEIWKGESRKGLIERWIKNDLPDHCRSCKYRSPQLLHWRFWVNWVRRGWL